MRKQAAALNPILRHLKEWVAPGYKRHIVCKPEDRLDLLAVFALRQAQTLEFGDWRLPLESMENGMLWLRSAPEGGAQ